MNGSPPSTGRLHGRRALVTGASRGIGRGIAVALARAGATVIVHHLGDADGAAAVAAEVAAAIGADDPASTIEVDISRDDAVLAMAQQIESEGGVDVLVNNAGYGARAPFFDVTPEMLDAALQVNVAGTFRVSQALARGMATRGRGSIVNVSSVSSFVGSADQVHYCASKAGINGLTVAMAVALGPHGIRVNAVLPGGVPTEMNRPAGVERAAWEGVGETLHPGSPVDRYGRPDDVAAAVRFLASDESSWITGALLPVDGGYAVMPRAVRNLRDMVAASAVAEGSAA